MEKKNVEVRIENIESYLEDVSLNEAIAFLQKKKDEYSVTYENIFTDYILRADRYDSTSELVVKGIRLENDMEFERRTTQEENAKNYRRQQYEQLKKEFDG